MSKGVYQHKKGWKHTKETKNKIRLNNSSKRRKGKTYEEIYGKEKSKKMKEKFREKMIGKHWKLSEKIKEKLRKPKSENTKIKMSEAKKGERHWNWQNGISYELYSLDWTQTLRRSIRERDHYTCQLCGELQSDKAFSIHHIDYNKKNCSPDNLIALCSGCNSRVNFNREYWKNYFINLKNA